MVYLEVCLLGQYIAWHVLITPNGLSRTVTRLGSAPMNTDSGGTAATTRGMTARIRCEGLCCVIPMNHRTTTLSTSGWNFVNFGPLVSLHDARCGGETRC
jgi:hypothetical protein